MNDIETYDSFFSQFAGVTPDDIVAYKKGGGVKKDKCGCKAKMLQSGGTQDDDANDNALKGFLNTMSKEEQQKNRERWKKENQEQKKTSQKKTKQQPNTMNKSKNKTTQTPKK